MIKQSFFMKFLPHFFYFLLLSSRIACLADESDLSIINTPKIYRRPFPTGFLDSIQSCLLKNQPSRSFTLARQIQREYPYHDLPFSELESICKIALTLQTKSKEKHVKIYHSYRTPGTFYRLASGNEVLYCPPAIDMFLLRKGSIKKVYKALFFTSSNVEIVAAGIGNKTMDQEIKVLRSLHFPQALRAYRCSFALPQGKRMLALRYYNKGSLRSMRSHRQFLTVRERLFVAKDSIQSLMLMHRMHVVHRDLHDGNVVVHRAEDGTISAGLIDFGRSIFLSHGTSSRPQGSPYRNPPEILLKEYSKIDQKQADVFALGCCFYRLFFGKMYRGSYMYNPRSVKHMKQIERKTLYSYVKKRYETEFSLFNEKNAHSTDPQEPLSPMAIFKKNIFLMIDPEPENRVSLSLIAKMIDAAIGMKHTTKCVTPKVR